MSKSTVEEIRTRFDNDVERFSNLETGQSVTIDAPLSLELITQVAASTNPDAAHLLDIGCGAGNYSLKMLSKLPKLNITLVDLSQPMLERAVERIKSVTSGEVSAHQADIRDLTLPEGHFDIILAAAVFHHLRDDDDWQNVFAKCFAALKPGGSMWISDLIDHEMPPARTVMWRGYGEYLTQFRDETYRDQVFAYIEKEDTPRSLLYQIDLLKKVGFRQVEILHKNGPFAAFGAVK
jgi:tRNA (cmo5U34)-methyltransferase